MIPVMTVLKLFLVFYLKMVRTLDDISHLSNE